MIFYNIFNLFKNEQNNQSDENYDNVELNFIEQNRSIGKFFTKPKPYDHVAFQYLKDAFYFGRAGILYRHLFSGYIVDPIGIITLSDKYCFSVADILRSDSNMYTNVGIVFPGSNIKFPSNSKEYKSKFYKFLNLLFDLDSWLEQLNTLLIKITFGWYKNEDDLYETYSYAFRDANYVEDPYCFMRTCVEKMNTELLKIFQYRPKMENLDIYGYSLGGGCALIALNEIVNLIIEKPEIAQNLKTIKVKTCSPTGLNPENIKMLDQSIKYLIKHNRQIKIIITHAIGFGDPIPLYLHNFIKEAEEKYPENVIQYLIVNYDKKAPIVAHLAGNENFARFLYRQGHYLPYSAVMLEEIEYAQVIEGFDNIEKFFKYGLCAQKQHEMKMDQIYGFENFLNSYGIKNCNTIGFYNFSLQFAAICSGFLVLEREIKDIKDNMSLLLDNHMISQDDAYDIVKNLQIYNDEDFINNLKKYNGLYQKLQCLKQENKFYNSSLKFILLKIYNYFNIIFSKVKNLLLQIIEIIIYIIFIIKYTIFSLMLQKLKIILYLPAICYYFLYKKNKYFTQKQALLDMNFYDQLQQKILYAKRLKVIQNFEDCTNDLLSNEALESQKQVRSSFVKFMKQDIKLNHKQKFIQFISKLLGRYGKAIYYY